MKRFSYFDLSAAPRLVRFGANKLLVVGLFLGLLLALGCSKEKSKPTNSARLNSSPATAPIQAVAPAAPTVAATQSAIQKPVARKAARKHSSMVTYKDDAYGMSFGYPRKYILKNGEDLKAASDSLSMNFVQPGGVPAVSVELPDKSYPGSDLMSAFFQVNVHKGLTEAECSQFAAPQSKPDDKNAVQPSEVVLGGMKFVEVENILGESAKQADTKYYHAFENGACYEFALGLTTGWDGNEEVNLVDREDVFRRLEKMLAGVKITQESAPTVASSDAKPAAASESVASPTQSTTAPMQPTTAAQQTTAPQPQVVK